MKKILILTLMAALVFTAAASAEDYDFSGKTTAELVEIQKKVNEALWASDGWNDVTVPAGLYEVGKEIPAGDWMVSRHNADDFLAFDVYKEKKGGELEGWKWTSALVNAEKVTLDNGNYVKIRFAPVDFKTYVPSFTFK